MISVALVDDHELVRLGFVQLLEKERDIQISFDCSSVSDAINHLSDIPTDIVVSDLSLQSECGFQLLEYIESNFEHTKSIVLSMHDTAPYVERAMRLGSAGYLSKGDAPDELIHAIHHVFQGNRFLSESVYSAYNSAGQLSEVRKFQTLTNREKQLFIYLANGTKVKRIAYELDIAVKTVHAHKENIFRKFDVNDAFSLTKIALRNGLIDVKSLQS